MTLIQRRNNVVCPVGKFKSINVDFISILWNSIALISNIFTELSNIMKYGEGVLYNFIFTELPFKTVSYDVSLFHRPVLSGHVLLTTDAEIFFSWVWMNRIYMSVFASTAIIIGLASMLHIGNTCENIAHLPYSSSQQIIGSYSQSKKNGSIFLDTSNRYATVCVSDTWLGPSLGDLSVSLVDLSDYLMASCTQVHMLGSTVSGCDPCTMCTDPPSSGGSRIPHPLSIVSMRGKYVYPCPHIIHTQEIRGVHPMLV